jgi:hypothetical protein
LDNDPHGGERNASRLKDLAERLLDHDYHVEVDYERPRLFLGELPTGLPAEIPVPAGMVLLGGLRRVRPWWGETDAQVILEAEVEPEGVYAAFREHLARSEWSEKRWPLLERGGFVSTGSRTRSLTFCLSPRGPSLSVSAYRRRGQDHGGPSAFGRLPAPRLALLGGLPPSRVRRSLGHTGAVPTRRGGADLGRRGSSSDSEENRAHLRPACPPRRSWGTTRRSWRRLGWSRAGGGEEGPTAWSGWTFEEDGEGWVGTLVAMSPPGPSEVCFVQVSASAVPEDLQ